MKYDVFTVFNFLVCNILWVLSLRIVFVVYKCEASKARLNIANEFVHFQDA